MGGPPVGPYNNRYEADLDNSGKMKLYYLSEDRRIHLSGADTGWLKVDYNYDSKVDMEFRYLDTDHDGVIDTWQIDVDGDGVDDRTVHVAHPHPRPVPLSYKSLTMFYNRSLDQALSDNQVLIDELKDVLKRIETDFKPDEIESYYTNELANYRKEAGVGQKIRNSRAGTRYYQDLIRERYFFRLSNARRSRSELLARIEAHYDAGDFAQTARLLSSEFPPPSTQTIGWPSGFTKRLPIHILNSGSSARLNEPVVLDVSAIRKYAADFNSRNFVVMTGARWISARELPSQADDLDGDGAADQLVFLSDLRANEEPEYWIYYSPTGELNLAPRSSPQKNVKALNTGDSPGLAGLTIWEAGKRYPVLKFHHRILSDGPVRTITQVDLDDFETDQNRYNIRERFSIYSNGRYSENSISFHPAKPATSIQFSLGFAKLRNDEYFFDKGYGYFGSWGRQNNIVQEIGQAAIFRTGAAVLKQDAKQREVLFTALPGETSTFYLVEDWRRQRMFPVAPTVANWQSETRALAARLHSPLHARIGNVESR